MTNEKNYTEISGVRQRIHKSVDRIIDKAESMRESGKENLARLKEKATTMKENVDSHIRKNPEKAVLIAAGAGAAVGAILTAAVMKKKALDSKKICLNEASYWSIDNHGQP